MPKFVKVASVSELSAGEGKVVDAEGQSIDLTNFAALSPTKQLFAARVSFSTGCEVDG